MTDIRQGWTSASNAAYDLACPGRHLAQKGLPELPETEDAASGTRIHAWLAGNPVELSDEEEEIARKCLAIRVNLQLQWQKVDATKHELYYEERLWCAVGGLQHSGQPDIVFIENENRALLIDYKTGRNEVPEPNTNQQLRDLAALASIRWPVDEVTVAIIQPFAKAESPCVYDESDLKRALRDLQHRVRLSNNPLAPRIAGEKQCRYCRAKFTCAEYSAWANQAMPLVANADLGLQPAWTPEQWAQFLTIAPEAESWIESKRAEAKQLLKENPEAIPGFALSDISEREKITNVQAVFEQATLRGVTTEAFMQAVSVTKKGLSNALRETGFEGKALKQAMTEILFGNVQKSEIEPKIVKTSNTDQTDAADHSSHSTSQYRKPAQDAE